VAQEQAAKQHELAVLVAAKEVQTTHEMTQPDDGRRCEIYDPHYWTASYTISERTSLHAHRCNGAMNPRHSHATFSRCALQRREGFRAVRRAAWCIMSEAGITN
jgi:hypothetical protein